MPDADRPMPDIPDNWNNAFAALPLETPPGDGWQRLSQTLDTTAPAHMARRRARWPLWLAAAATVSAVALVPVLMRESAPQTSPVATVPVSPPKAAITTVSPPASTPPHVESAPAAEPRVAVDTNTDDDIAANKRRKATPTRPPVRTQALPSTTAQTRIAATEPARDTTTDTALASLQAESAQLEALVALARDDRVASANGAALTGVLDERVARIDATLSQPGLDGATRTGLWRERVAALRELATVETTQRWLAAQGERLDGALVSVD